MSVVRLILKLFVFTKYVPFKILLEPQLPSNLEGSLSLSFILYSFYLLGNVTSCIVFVIICRRKIHTNGHIISNHDRS